MKNERRGIVPQRLISWAKWFVRQQVSTGDICVDATVGNGNDTLFLAECVGKDSHSQQEHLPPVLFVTQRYR